MSQYKIQALVLLVSCSTTLKNYYSVILNEACEHSEQASEESLLTLDENNLGFYSIAIMIPLSLAALVRSE